MRNTRTIKANTVDKVLTRKTHRVYTHVIIAIGKREADIRESYASELKWKTGEFNRYSAWAADSNSIPMRERSSVCTVENLERWAADAKLYIESNAERLEKALADNAAGIANRRYLQITWAGRPDLAEKAAVKLRKDYLIVEVYPVDPEPAAVPAPAAEIPTTSDRLEAYKAENGKAMEFNCLAGFLTWARDNYGDAFATASEYETLIDVREHGFDVAKGYISAGLVSIGDLDRDEQFWAGLLPDECDECGYAMPTRPAGTQAFCSPECSDQFAAVERCPDCGEANEPKGHMTCQFPQN